MQTTQAAAPKFVAVVAVIASMLLFTLVPQRVRADGCTWKGDTTAYWSNSNNWNCSSGGTPTSDDDVIIDGGKPFEPILQTSTSIKSLTLNGPHLTISLGAKLTVGGTTTANGGTQIVLDGELASLNLDVMPGTTKIGGFGKITGPAHINLLSTLQSAPGGTLTLDDDLTNDGTLYSTGDLIVFKGSTFINNGKVDGPYLRFAGASTQSIMGSGEWVGTGSLQLFNGRTTTLANSMQMKMMNLALGSGSMLDVGTRALALQGTTVSVPMGNSIGGSGSVNADATSFSNDGVISPTLVITHNVTAGGLGLYTGAISVTRGATLTIAAFANLSVAGDLRNEGAILGPAQQLLFSGSNLTNNGLVHVAALNFKGVTQTLQGTGVLSSTTATVFAGSRLNLGSDHHLYNLHIQGNGSADLGGHTLMLDQNGAPLAVTGILSTTGSNIVYNGTLTQTIAYNNVRYHSLTISNTAIAVAPNIELYVAGDFTNTSVFKHSNGLLFLNGSLPQTINGVSTDFFRLTVTNTKGVTVTTNTSVTSTLVLSGDMHIKTGNVMTFAGTSRGDYDVFGTIKRSGFITETGYAFGSPFMVITPTAGTMPSDILFTLQGTAPSGLSFAAPRTYIITPTNSLLTATLQLHYRDSELMHVSAQTLQMWRDNTGQWTRYHKQAWDVVHQWMQRREVSNFGTWALAVGYLDFLPIVIR